MQAEIDGEAPGAGVTTSVAPCRFRPSVIRIQLQQNAIHASSIAEASSTRLNILVTVTSIEERTQEVRQRSASL